ncbi:MAG: hypothetical protein VZR33_09925 [Methanosphaera sp.]|nr:hypothetical protein [Methanosphaera sp.]
MANNYNNFQNQTNQQLNQPMTLGAQQNQVMLPTYQQNPILFPQPVGNVYNLSAANEIGNIPMGSGLSVGLCLAENILYIKSLQNGNPMLLGYRLTPLENAVSDNEIDGDKIKEVFKQFNERLATLEENYNKIKGGKINWEI